ncbi:MAG: hypothetical protein JWO14_448 [Solirubrobacterales bacterium]|nr:hypothetical protein [Solirubrobacterales bacterium]
MEEDWTDKRMDDFADRVGRFEGDVKERFDKVDKRFDRLEAKVDMTNRTIWAGIFVAVVVKLLFG